MSFSMAFWAAVVASVTGVAAIWSNPRRPVNCALFPLSLHVGLWLMCLHLSLADGGDAFSARLAAVLLALLFPHVWWVKDVIVQPSAGWRERFWRCRIWLGFAGLLAAWVASGFFLPYSSGTRPEAAGQLIFLAGVGLGACVFAVMSVAELNVWRGARRLETQVLLMGVGAAAAVMIVCTGLAVWLDNRIFLEPMPLAIIAIHAGTVWALTSTEVLDARHIISAVVERLALVAIVVLFVGGLQQLARQFVHETIASVLALTLGLWFAAEVHPWLRAAFRRGSRSSQLRRKIFEVASKELRPDALEDAFLQALKDGTRAEHVVILMSSQSRLVGAGLEFPIDSPVMKALHTLRWVTPERLERARFVPEREALRDLLMEHGFGLLVANNGPALSFVVAVGTAVTRQPFTQPEILRLADVAASMENSLSRARYLRQAQHAEQLATVGMLGASIAHEIRNPLVSIKTFVQLLPSHYEEAAFRDKFFRLIGDEVGRIDRLTEQLLDLAAPRMFASQSVEIHPILRSCIDLVTAKAEDKGVKLISTFQAAPDHVQTDPNAVKQVILNLSFNAIQALEQQTGERWIRIETTKLIDSVEVAVSDSGPGIAPEVWSRLFQPFQSTKSSGFGLGLAICKDILSSLQASISADPPTEGCGATFRIVLPCPPPTS